MLTVKINKINLYYCKSLIYMGFVFCFFLRQFGESLDLLTFGLGSTGISTKLSTEKLGFIQSLFKSMT